MPLDCAAVALVLKWLFSRLACGMHKLNDA